MSASDFKIKPENTTDLHKVEEELPACNLTVSTENSPENLASRIENVSISDTKPSLTSAESIKDLRRQQCLKDSMKTFHPLKHNVFLDRKKRIPTEDDIYVCECVKAEPDIVPYLELQNPHVSYNCGDKCINRYMCTECEQESCPCGEYCQNRRFQLHQINKVYPKQCGGKGWGLFAGENIKKGDFVLQYIGEVMNVNSDEGQIRIETYNRSTCTYLMKITQNEVIDPTFRGNLARFINHSCDPNCITQKWNVMGEICVGVFAIKDIREDAELTFDYQFDSFKTPLTKCLCGAYNCKGYLGRKPQEYSLEEWEERLENLPCSICGQNVEDDDDKLLLCDSCHEGFHIFCLDPPLTEIPDGAWYCDKCKVKMEQEEKSKKDFNPLEMNTKLYELVKKEKLKLQAYERTRRIASSEEEEDDDEEEDEEEEESHKSPLVKGREERKAERRKLRFMEEEEEDEHNDEMLLRKKANAEAERNKYLDMYPASEGDEDEINIRIKRKKKSSEIVPVDQATKDQLTEESADKAKDAEGTKEGKKEAEMREGLEEKTLERTDSKKDKKKPRVLRTQASMVNDFKEKALAMFSERMKDKELLERIQEVERRNSRGTWALFGGADSIDKKSKMINSIQLEVVKRNQIIFRRIGTRLFWEHHRGGKINIFKKHVETTIMGYKEQIEVAELVFHVLEDIAEEIERMRGQRDAVLRIPAMYLRKITGSYHNQQITDLENRFEISIQYSKDYLNDGCYSMTTMTDLKIKGVKENVVAVYQYINSQIKKLKTKRLFCNRRDYTTLLKNLNGIKRKIHPAELRFSKTKEGALKELNHPFYYIQYKEKEVALIGTEKEISEAEKILEDVFRDAHIGSDEYDFGCVHYLWPTTNTSQQILQSFKAEIEKEVPGTRFVYFEPIVPRKNMTLSIFGSFKEMARAKEILKEKVETLRSTSLTLEAFQEHVKYQIIKYLFKCLHNFYITGNIADIKFWDLQSVEFEKIYRMTPLRKQTLQNIFLKDTTLQLYVLHICDFSDSRIWDHFRLSSKSVIDLLKKLLQSSMNANSNVVANMQCERIFKRSKDFSHHDFKRPHKQGHTPQSSPYYSRSDKGWDKKSDKDSNRGRDRSDSRSHQKSERSSKISREGSRSVDSSSSHEKRQIDEGVEEFVKPESVLIVPEIKQEEKVENISDYKERPNWKESNYDNPSPDNRDRRASQALNPPQRRENYPSYHDRPYYQKDYTRQGDRGDKPHYGYRYQRRDDSGRSYSRGASRSRSRSKSIRRRSRSPRREYSDKYYERRDPKDFDRDPNYNKGLDAYLNPNEKEVGHYEKLLFNKRRDVKEGDYHHDRKSPRSYNYHDRDRNPHNRSRSRERDRNESRSNYDYRYHKHHDYHRDRPQDRTERERNYYTQRRIEDSRRERSDEKREPTRVEPSSYEKKTIDSPRRADLNRPYRNEAQNVERSSQENQAPNIREIIPSRENVSNITTQFVQNQREDNIIPDKNTSRNPPEEPRPEIINKDAFEGRNQTEGVESSYQKRNTYRYEEKRNERDWPESSSTGMNRNRHYETNKDNWYDRQKQSRFSSSIQEGGNNDSQYNSYSRYGSQNRPREYHTERDIQSRIRVEPQDNRPKVEERSFDNRPRVEERFFDNRPRREDDYRPYNRDKGEYFGRDRGGRRPDEERDYYNRESYRPPGRDNYYRKPQYQNTYDRYQGQKRNNGGQGGRW